MFDMQLETGRTSLSKDSSLERKWTFERNIYGQSAFQMQKLQKSKKLNQNGYIYTRCSFHLASD